jgi:hypothetical protein
VKHSLGSLDGFVLFASHTAVWSTFLSLWDAAAYDVGEPENSRLTSIKNIKQLEDGRLELSSPSSHWVTKGYIDFSFIPQSPGAKPAQYRITDYTNLMANVPEHMDFWNLLRDAEKKGPVKVQNFGFQNGVFSADRLSQVKPYVSKQAASSTLKSESPVLSTQD